MCKAELACNKPGEIGDAGIELVCLEFVVYVNWVAGIILVNQPAVYLIGTQPNFPHESIIIIIVSVGIRTWSDAGIKSIIQDYSSVSHLSIKAPDVVGPGNINTRSGLPNNRSNIVMIVKFIDTKKTTDMIDVSDHISCPHRVNGSFKFCIGFRGNILWR